MPNSHHKQFPPHEWKWWNDADKADLKTNLKKAMRRRYKMKLKRDEEYLSPSKKEALDKLPHYRN